MLSTGVSAGEILVGEMMKRGTALDAAQLTEIADAVGREFSVQTE